MWNVKIRAPQVKIFYIVQFKIEMAIKYNAPFPSPIKNKNFLISPKNWQFENSNSSL